MLLILVPERRGLNTVDRFQTAMDVSSRALPRLSSLLDSRPMAYTIQALWLLPVRVYTYKNKNFVPVPSLIID